MMLLYLMVQNDSLLYLEEGSAGLRTAMFWLMHGEQLNNISSAIHLGHSISADDSEYTISALVVQVWKSFNIFRADYDKIYPYVQCKVFKQYCCSCYGGPL